MRILAQFISWILMPLIIPALALAIVLFLPTELSFTNHNSLYFWDIGAKKYLIGIFLFFGFILPGFSVFIMRYARMIKSVEMETQRERSIPLILTAVYCMFLILLLLKLNTTTIISAHLFGLAFSGLFMALLFAISNASFKISLHAGGAGMLIAFVLSYSLDQTVFLFWPIYMTVLLAGIILFARLYLQKHTPKELYLGFILGSIVTFIADYQCVLWF